MWQKIKCWIGAHTANRFYQCPRPELKTLDGNVLWLHTDYCVFCKKFLAQGVSSNFTWIELK